jgi:hypothetical protein
VQRKTSLTLKGQAKDKFEELIHIASQQELAGMANSGEKQLLKSITQKSELLKMNPTAGTKIPRVLIPAGLNVSNHFKINLCGYHRMVYTLNINTEEVAVFVLWIISHPEYDRIFGYRKR